MPRYFFDVETGVRKVRDETGIDLPDARAIRPEIARLISDFVPSAALTGRGCRFDIIVRNEASGVIERSTTYVPLKSFCGSLQEQGDHPERISQAHVSLRDDKATTGHNERGSVK